MHRKRTVCFSFLLAFHFEREVHRCFCEESSEKRNLPPVVEERMYRREHTYAKRTTPRIVNRSRLCTWRIQLLPRRMHVQGFTLSFLRAFITYTFASLSLVFFPSLLFFPCRGVSLFSFAAFFLLLFSPVSVCAQRTRDVLGPFSFSRTLHA